MRSKFDEQLKKLNEEMMHMGSMIEESIQKAIEAFIHQDSDSAKAIMEGDSEIDREQKKIESLCFNLLMQQPVARDLRTISAAMKMVTDMERIGDHAADISEMTILMSSDKPYRVNIEHVKSMASETMLMLIRAIEAYVEKNNDKARIVMKQDDVVDDLFDKVKAELIDFIREHPEDGEQAEDLLMVAKYFERIGDHATNIAEWVEFALDDKVRKS
ncbi:phosphate signaling complex protein PhoU [Agathobacter rectalis]|uniref:phosphate signaling complex protein PhoU n=1 Tax=Agathobacter rectalis TaxID=39491 RepID=UPI0027D22273|nr:phosphate signaling complex protein PhoU [Agathobacter rectalis]